ncbi:MAG: hypothetical protein KatS3mg115_0385 [Candidatus Poribacteria bacterium]|nr:MAG: hypothetical protein KatS3mg115_0385 [Candidatus Poribacteria bacterium]
MAKKERLLTLEEAAEFLGITRTALYSRIRRARARGENVPFRRDSGRSGKLVVTLQALRRWLERRGEPIPGEKGSSPVPTPERVDSQYAPPAERLAPTAPSVEEAAQPAAEPKPTRGAPIIEQLPESYMENQVTALFQAPDTLVVYWDVHPETAKRFEGRRWGLLLKTEDGEEVIEIANGAKNWYVRKPNLAKEYEITFGPFDETGQIVPIAKTIWRRPKLEAPQWGRAVQEAGRVRLEPVPEPEITADVGALQEASRGPLGAGSAEWVSSGVTSGEQAKK